MTKKKQKQKQAPPAVTNTALTPITAADLVSAGIVDFKLTKDDLIDLLVEEATRVAQEDLDRLHAEATASNRRCEELVAQCTEALRTYIKRSPVFLAAAEGYPDYKWLPHHGEGVVVVVFGSSEMGYALRLDFAINGHANAPTVKAARDALSEHRKYCDTLNTKIYEAQEIHSRIKSSSRKLRAALIRQVLATNNQGKLTLDQVGALATSVLSAVSASVAAELPPR